MKRKFVMMVMSLGLLLPPMMVAGAQDGLTLVVQTIVRCKEVEFNLNAPWDAAAFTLTWGMGDDVVYEEEGVSEFPHTLKHDYLAPGDYTWTLTATDGDVSTATQGVVTIDGPSVNLTSDPFPPLLDVGQEGLVKFTAETVGGTTSYTYAWDLNGDGVFEETGVSASASYTYSETGKTVARVEVTDGCGITVADTLPIIVADPESEEVCHPTAQTIADGVNALFPQQAGDLYTCEEIFDIFTGGLTGSQLGFGILKHAIKLSTSIEDLTWEEIRDWHLEGTGWGLLTQLDRYADELGEVGIGDLLELVGREEYSLGDIRAALRAAVRYDSDFEDALARLAAGASQGELGQLYRTAQELGVDPTELDVYLDGGVSLADVRHAAKSADQLGVEWQALLDSHTAGHSWGDIKQAYKLADGTMNAEAILEMGIKEYRKQAREGERNLRMDEKNQRTAAQIADRFGVGEDVVWSVFEGTCGYNWGCVRKHFHPKK